MFFYKAKKTFLKGFVYHLFHDCHLDIDHDVSTAYFRAEYPIIKLYAKRIKLNLLFKLSYLSSNFALNLGYLNPASNNPAQVFIIKSCTNGLFNSTRVPERVSVNKLNLVLEQRRL